MNKYSAKTPYSDYVNAQVVRSQQKWHSTTFSESNFIKTLLTALDHSIVDSTKKNLRPETFLCLGIRNGNEYTSLKRYQSSIAALNKTKVFGVDINEEVTKVGDHCFAYDFNHLPADWLSKFDYAYSNALDHCFDVGETLKEWHRVLKHDRFLLLQLSTDIKLSASDRYSFTKDDVPRLFPERQYEVKLVWEEFQQQEKSVPSFNVLVRIKKV